LAETRLADPPRHTTGSAIAGRDGTSRWTTWTEVDVDSGDFGALGAAFEATGAVTLGPVGAATASLMSQREAVDFATSWLPRHRPAWN